MCQSISLDNKEKGKKNFIANSCDRDQENDKGQQTLIPCLD